MPTPKLSNLSPDHVVALQDALLHNADSLLNAAIAVLDLGNTALAQSLAMRVQMVYAPKGEPFVDAELRKLWATITRS